MATKKTETGYKITCDMERDCESEVSMLDNKGFAYCAPHGMQRRMHGTPCRKLKLYELRKLFRGEPLQRY